jgi:hypothetical protein
VGLAAATVGEPRRKLNPQVEFGGEVALLFQVEIDPGSPFGRISRHQLVEFFGRGGSRGVDTVVIRDRWIVRKEQILFAACNEL